MLRHEFYLPPGPGGAPAIYFCGNSLGPQPRAAAAALDEQLATWRERGVEGWWRGGWLDLSARIAADLAPLLGARPEEVAVANALTVNLHLLLASFYRPRGRRRLILMERGAFPSDQHAVISQLRWRGLDPEDCLLELGGGDAGAVLEERGEEVALLLWGGVHYYSGEYYDLAGLAAAARAAGATVGLDLAHAVGNVPLRLHDWGVDFAVWCNYKYVNGGPGAPGGLFVHARHAAAAELPRLAGWWGHRAEDRFLMRRDFVPERGAAGWAVSTPPILGLAPLAAALPLFARAGGMAALRARSRELTAALYAALADLPNLRPLTPAEPDRRGAQLSVYVPGDRPDLERQLVNRGLICDYRRDNRDGSGGGVLRLAPAPLFNTLEEVHAAVDILAEVLAAD